MSAEAFEPPRSAPASLESTARLAEMWPATAPRLLRVLRLRGVDSQRAEDLVQEAGTRALELGMPFASSQDLYRWSACVVRNLHVDLTRDAARLTGDQLLAELPSCDDVEHQADRRRALAAVISAMASLTADERRAVLSGVLADLEGDDAAAGTIAVRRFRARRKLRAITSGVLAWLGVVSARSARWVRGDGDGPAVVATAVVVSLTAGVLAAQIGLPESAPARRPMVAPAAEGMLQASERRGSGAAAAAVPVSVPAAGTRGAARHGRVPAPAAAPTRVTGPAGTSASYEKRPADPDEPILCLSGLPLLPRTCSPVIGPSSRAGAQPKIAAWDDVAQANATG